MRSTSGSADRGRNGPGADDGDDGSRRRAGEGRPRRAYGRALAVGLVLSLAGHLLAIELFPTIEPPDLSVVASDFRAVEVRPVEVEMPPRPDPVPRPDVPRVQETRVDARTADVSPPALDAASGVGELPPPPPPADNGWEPPSYIRHQVAPRPDRKELERERLERYYPPNLERSGVEGIVDLWVYVNETGEVTRSRVISSSGHARMDTAAVKVARERNYLPALNRDQPIGVWVTQRVCFVQESRHEVEETDDCATLVRGG